VLCMSSDMKEYYMLTRSNRLLCMNTFSVVALGGGGGGVVYYTAWVHVLNAGFREAYVTINVPGTITLRGDELTAYTSEVDPSPVVWPPWNTGIPS
jgi:hypothetical protein